MANTDLLETQLRNCYLSLGGDLSDVMTRLPSLAHVKNSCFAFRRMPAMRSWSLHWSADAAETLFVPPTP